METELIKFEVVAAVIIKDKKVLMCRSRTNAHYYCPGGKIEKMESLEQAIIRECKEEINIDINAKSIKPFCRFEAEAYGFDQPRIVIMNCFSFDFSGEIKASAEIKDLLWCNFADLEKLAPAGQVLLKKLKEQKLID